ARSSSGSWKGFPLATSIPSWAAGSAPSRRTSRSLPCCSSGRKGSWAIPRSSACSLTRSLDTVSRRCEAVGRAAERVAEPRYRERPIRREPRSRGTARALSIVATASTIPRMRKMSRISVASDRAARRSQRPAIDCADHTSCRPFRESRTTSPQSMAYCCSSRSTEYFMDRPPSDAPVSGVQREASGRVLRQRLLVHGDQENDALVHQRLVESDQPAILAIEPRQERRLSVWIAPRRAGYARAIDADHVRALLYRPSTAGDAR